MPTIFIDGHSVEAKAGQTVIEAARAAGIEIPHFCWHPALSTPGNCRVCMVEIDDGWLDIACNMPIKEGMHVQTDSPAVREQRQAILQLLTLNHPVDCGICDKAGECTLQDYHYRYNGTPSISSDAKLRSGKFQQLSERIVLDNERCILCSRCVRFTREVSRSNGLGIEERADISLVRAAEDGAFARDHYSDNVVDLCPVGALLSKPFLYRSRVWYLEPTASICPGCERGCSIDIWHRRADWRLQAVATAENERITRVTPRDNPAVNGPWICNKGRDLAVLFERPRATQALLAGQPVALEQAMESARVLLAEAKRPVALVSSWGSNEELQAFAEQLAASFTCFVMSDHQPLAGEPIEDELLIRPDKNPNGRRARELFGSASLAWPEGTDLVLAWGEGCDLGALPPNARVIVLDAWSRPGLEHADVFLPLSTQLERAGHYTNYAGVVSAFEACFNAPAGVADAETLFATLGARGAR